MKMFEIEVSVINRSIVLTQDEQNIAITAEQAEFVCKWISEAARAIPPVIEE